MAVPALRKGQYSTSGCNGQFAFKRRYTDTTTDSYVLVTISGGATFSSIPNGTYVDCITGDTKTVTNGTLSVSCSGKGNMRVYVLNTELTKAPGKIGTDGKYLYQSSSVAGSNPAWDGTQEELDDRFGAGGNGGGGSSNWGDPVEPCLESASERAVFFQATQDFGTSAAVYMWIKGSETNLLGAWPGQRATHLGGGTFKFVIPDNVTGDESQWMIIWNNNNGGKQTGDMTFTMRGLYTMNGYQSKVTTLCEGGDTGETPEDPKPDPTPDPEPTPSEMCLNSADERAVFYQGSNFGTSVYVYMWDPTSSDKQLSGAWPGTAATNLGDGKFKFVVPASATGEPSNWKIIWNNGNGGEGNQTADLAFTMHGIYNFNGCNGTVTALCEGGEVPTPDPDPEPDPDPTPDPDPQGITVKAKVPAHWTETITAWVWADGMDGRAVTPTKDGEWYVVTENVTSLNIIFRNGTDWNGNANQTEDITNITTNTCYQLSQSGDAKASATVVDCEGGDVPVDPNPEDPKPEDPKEGITVKALMPAHWTETITAWVWPEGGDGRVVTPSKDGDWYVVTEDAEVLNIIFRNGTDWNGNPNQTEDMQFTANTCIQLAQSGDAKATYTVVDCPIATDVEDVEVQKPVARKVLINQSLYLVMPNGDVYDISGRQVR
jgi:hypothetical protein